MSKNPLEIVAANCSEVQVFKIKDHHGYELIGQAVSSRRSCVVVPLFDLCFDMGFCPNSAMDQALVLVTHGHADHVGALHFHAFDRKLHDLATPTYVMPEECVEWFNQAHDAYKMMGRHGLDDPAKLNRNYDLFPATKQQTVAPPRRPNPDEPLLYLRKGAGKKFFIRGYRMQHTVPNVGYILWEVKKKLKPEFQGLSTKEIGQLARSGQVVDDRFEVPRLGYTGDTKIGGILAQPDMLRVETLILECTYIEEETGGVETSQKEAHRRGHIHERDLIENVKEFQNKELILCHFSLRYTRTQVFEAQQRLQEAFGSDIKVSVLMN